MKQTIDADPHVAFEDGVKYGLEVASAALTEIIRQGANRIFIDYADEFNSVTVPVNYNQTDDPEGYIDFEAYRAPGILAPTTARQTFEAVSQALSEAARQDYIPRDAEKFGKIIGKRLANAEENEDMRISEIVVAAVKPCDIYWDEGVSIKTRADYAPQPKSPSA